MENKFTFEHSHSFDKKIVLNNSSYHADFRDEKDAQEYVAWKNQKMIDREMKKEIVEMLTDFIADTGRDLSDKYHHDFDDALEIIKSLREA